MDLNSVILVLKESAQLTTLLPIATGGAIKFLDRWIVPPDKFRERIDYVESILFEKLTLSHRRALQNFFDTDLTLTNTANPSSAPVEAHSKTTIKTALIFLRLRNLRRSIRILYSLLLATVIASIFLFFGAIFEPLRIGIFAATIILVCIQVFVIWRLHYLDDRLISYERKL